MVERCQLLLKETISVFKENVMNITTVVQIIKIESHIDVKGVVSFSEAVEEVFDHTKGSSTADICQKAFDKCKKLNSAKKDPNISYVTNRID